MGDHPQIVYVSMTEWRKFNKACAKVGVQPTFDTYWKWRTGKLEKKENWWLKLNATKDP